MTDKEKKPLSETAFDRKLDARIREIQDAQAKRDAEQDAKLRPSRAMEAMKTTADFTLRYPLASSLAGLAFIAGGVVWLDGAKMWTLVGVGICLVPGLAMTVVRLATGLKKAKGS